MPARLQSSLGATVSTSLHTDRNWTDGALSIGKVVRVHHKRYTADVILYSSAMGRTNTSIMSDSNKEGANACRIMCTNAGYDERTGRAYGSIVPIEPGSLVVVGCLDNNPSTPVILGVLHNGDENVGTVNNKNILTSAYPMTDDAEKYRKLDITRTQDFKTIDGNGNFQLYSHTHSFLLGTNKRTIDGETFSWSSLDIRNPDGTVIGLPDTEENEKVNSPLQYLACFMRSLKQDVMDSLRVFIDASKSVFRLAQNDTTNGRLSSINIAEDGSIHLRRQLDTTSWDTSDSSRYTDVGILEDGSVQVMCNDGSKSVTIDISGGRVQVQSSSDISIKGSNISIDGDTTVRGNLNVTGSINR